jgi:hypothetical protein
MSACIAQDANAQGTLGQLREVIETILLRLEEQGKAR